MIIHVDKDKNQCGYKLTIIKYDDLIDIYRSLYLTSTEYTIFSRV